MIKDTSLKVLEKRQRKEKLKRRKRKINETKQRALEWYLKRMANIEEKKFSGAVETATATAWEIFTPNKTRVEL